MQTNLLTTRKIANARALIRHVQCKLRINDKLAGLLLANHNEVIFSFI